MLHPFLEESNKDITGLIQAITKAAADGTSKPLTHERIDETCGGCSMYGHNVYETGCDHCAQYILTQRYLENNPQSVKTILGKNRQHQKNMQLQRQSRPRKKR